MRRFYLAFPYPHAVRADISWSHYRLLVSCDTQGERDWYLNATVENGWGERELKRQIQTRAYWRLLATQKKNPATPPQANPATPSPTLADDILKDPYVFEFVPEPPRRESDLEQALIDSLQAFLMELGQGFTFYARQKHVTSGDNDYYIDLVLYNYELDCFVLIDLKTHEVTPEDVGQMDFYVRLFDDRYKPGRSKPTIGLILGTSKSDAVARYTNLADRANLYAAGYLDHLPTERELEVVLERNRRMFELTADVRRLEGDTRGADN